MQCHPHRSLGLLIAVCLSVVLLPPPLLIPFHLHTHLSHATFLLRCSSSLLQWLSALPSFIITNCLCVCLDTQIYPNTHTDTSIAIYASLVQGLWVSWWLWCECSLPLLPLPSTTTHTHTLTSSSPLLLSPPPHTYKQLTHILTPTHTQKHRHTKMAAARPQISVYNAEGAAVGEVPLPAVLTVSVFVCVCVGVRVCIYIHTFDSTP